jgi:hypothetical protein
VKIDYSPFFPAFLALAQRRFIIRDIRLFAAALMPWCFTVGRAGFAGDVAGFDVGRCSRLLMLVMA